MGKVKGRVRGIGNNKGKARGKPIGNDRGKGKAGVGGTATV